MFKLNNDNGKIKLELRSNNIGPWIIDKVLKAPLFKNPLVDLITKAMNSDKFINEVNKQLKGVINNLDKIQGDVLNGLRKALPTNDIAIDK